MSQNQSKIEIATPQEVAQYSPVTAGEAQVAREAEPAGAPAESQEQASDELTTLRAKVAELQDKFLRAKAEAQNVVRRAQQERTEAVRYGNAELLRALLPVVDDFERTLAAASGGQTVPVVEGVKLIYDKLIKLLRDQGVEALEVVGKPFDPTEHAAIMQQPSDRHEQGTVIQEVQQGYRYGDRILRPAQVIIAQGPAGPASDRLETEATRENHENTKERKHESPGTGNR
jgi:molecular chaperone GrpE